MKFNLTKYLLVCALLVGCAQTQIPYHLALSVEKDYRLMSREMPLGVTQEKISENKYRVTAKLTKLSSHKRASSMALYHAAILAEEQGYDAFLVTSTMGTDGCSRASSTSIRRTSSGTGRTSATVMHRTSVTDAQPRVGLLITLLDYEKAEKTKKLKLAQTIKDRHKDIIDYVPTQVELEQVAEDKIAGCKQKMAARRG